MSAARIIQVIRAILFAGLAAATAAHAATKPAPAPAPSVTDTCLMCHADKDAKGAAGKSIAVDGAKFAASVHGEMKLKCTDCHADVSVDKLPHPDKLKPVNCATCHDKAVKEYAGNGAWHGAQGRQLGRRQLHGLPRHARHPAHRRIRLPRTNHANVEATCAKCHGSDTMAATGKMPGGNIDTKFHDSIHGKALKGAAQGSAPTCTNCHGAHNIRPKADEKSRTNRATVPETCGTCHKPQRDEYMNGMHGKLRQDGVLAAPGCTDCHSAHGIQQHDTPKFQTEVIKECGTCHADYLATYRDTFHGQVTALGFSRTATCASCHGAHAVLPASNPASKVSKSQPVEDVPDLPRRRVGQFRELRSAREPARQGARSDLSITPRNSWRSCSSGCSRSSACTRSSGSIVSCG